MDDIRLINFNELTYEEKKTLYLFALLMKKKEFTFYALFNYLKIRGIL